MAALGAILIVVAYNMSEWHAFKNLLTAPKADVTVLLITFLLTVLVDLTVAIEVGMIMAAFLFMKRMAEVTNVSVIAREFSENVDENDLNSMRTRRVPRGVVVYEINGPFFFGAAETFKDTLARTMGKPRVLILRLRNVPAIDATGLHALRDVVHRSRRDGTLVLLSDVHAQPMMALGRSSVLDDIGEEQIFGNVDDALNRARREMGLPELPPPDSAGPTVERERLTPYGGTPIPSAVNPDLLEASTERKRDE
jgi:SulP family sulfate permease